MQVGYLKIVITNLIFLKGPKLSYFSFIFVHSSLTGSEKITNKSVHKSKIYEYGISSYNSNVTYKHEINISSVRTKSPRLTFSKKYTLTLFLKLQDNHFCKTQNKWFMVLI